MVEIWRSRCVLVLLSAILLAASPEAARRVVMIPGPIRSAPAPDASGARIFYRPHIDPDGGQASPVFYDDGHGHVRQVATLMRSMGIGWSPDGKRAFLQDNLGSNIADCYILTRTPNGVTGLSLLKLAQRTPGHPTGAERPFDAHYYVHCDQWRSSEQIAGAVSGHTDTSPFRDFDHPFIYDTRLHRISWR